MNFAARRADAIFVGQYNIEDAKAYYKELKGRVAAFGRDPDKVLILPAARPLVGRTEAEAEEKYRELASLVSVSDALHMLGRPFNGHDFSTYPLDEPFPDVAHLGINSQQSAVLKIVRTAQEERLTLRETALYFATPRNMFTGTPVQVADALQEWFEERAADGFVTLESLPGQLEVFVETVVPLLQQRGIFRKPMKAARSATGWA